MTMHPFNDDDVPPVMVEDEPEEMSLDEKIAKADAAMADCAVMGCLGILLACAAGGLVWALVALLLACFS